MAINPNSSRLNIVEPSEIRRRTMQSVKSKNTAPELRVRKILHKHGYRFRIHRKDLPGCPDLSFQRQRKIIFVHGCFWHGHDCVRGSRLPKTNLDYWTKKISSNKQRDLKNRGLLEEAGWKILVIWECEIKDIDEVFSKASRFLLPS